MNSFNDVYGLVPLLKQGTEPWETVDVLLTAIAKKKGREYDLENPKFEDFSYLIDNYNHLVKFGAPFNMSDLWNFSEFCGADDWPQPQYDEKYLMKMLRLDKTACLNQDNHSNWLADICRLCPCLIIPLIAKINAKEERIDINAFLEEAFIEDDEVDDYYGLIEELMNLGASSERILEWEFGTGYASGCSNYDIFCCISGEKWINNAEDINRFINDLLSNLFQWLDTRYYELVLGNFSLLIKKGFNPAPFLERLSGTDDINSTRFMVDYDTEEKLSIIIKYYPILKDYGVDLDDIVSRFKKLSIPAVLEHADKLRKLGATVDI